MISEMKSSGGSLPGYRHGRTQKVVLDIVYSDPVQVLSGASPGFCGRNRIILDLY